MATAHRTVVLGGGIVGVTTAYYLARAGCQVTVIEQRSQAGMETSFANGSLITPSMSDPWASPEIPGKLLKWLGREDSPFLLRPSALPGLFGWGVKFLRECTADAWLRNTRNIFRLCSFSRDALTELVAETAVDYDASRRGTLHLFHDAESMDATRRVADALAAMGLSHQVLDGAGCVELEPMLTGQSDSIVGGIHYPEDEAGDAHRFTQGLAQYCAAQGVTFRYDETIGSIDCHNGKVASVVTNKERIDVDACVVALGNGSAEQVRTLGIKLPIYPVKGYSLTYPVSTWNGAPKVPFVDDVKKVGVVRLGERIRVAGTAEFTGHDQTLNPRRIASLERHFFELFPDYPYKSQGKAWTGLRPMTPDGIPYLGGTQIEGLYLNTGHGHLGWTMSCGSAKVIADLMTRGTSEFDLSGMTLEGR